MKRFLLDTNIPSEMTRPRRQPSLSGWLDDADDDADGTAKWRFRHVPASAWRIGATHGNLRKNAIAEHKGYVVLFFGVSLGQVSGNLESRYLRESSSFALPLGRPFDGRLQPPHRNE